MGTYLRYFTFLDHDTIRALDAETAEHPERRERAAGPGPRGVHARARRRPRRARAEAAAQALYSGEIASLDEQTLLEVCAETPTSTRPRAALDGGGVSLVDALVDAGLATSKGQARTHDHPGRGVRERPAGRRTSRRGSAATDLLFDRYLVLRKGAGLPSRLRFELSGPRPVGPSPGGRA